MKWFFVVLKKYAVFAGRAQRREFWCFGLVACIVALALLAIDIATDTYDREVRLGLLSGIFVLAILLPSIAVGVRRLHDMGKSGWWWLISLIPFIGSIVLLIMCAQSGESGSNQYGPDPRRRT